MSADLIEAVRLAMTDAWPDDDDGRTLPCALCEDRPTWEAITSGAGAVHATHADTRGIVGALAESEYVTSGVQMWTVGPLILGIVSPRYPDTALRVQTATGYRVIEREADILPALLDLWGVES